MDTILGGISTVKKNQAGCCQKEGMEQWVLFYVDVSRKVKLIRGHLLLVGEHAMLMSGGGSPQAGKMARVNLTGEGTTEKQR